MAIAHAHMHVLGIGPTRIWTILVTHIFIKLDNHNDSSLIWLSFVYIMVRSKLSVKSYKHIMALIMNIIQVTIKYRKFSLSKRYPFLVVT